MARAGVGHWLGAALAVAVLAGCEAGQSPFGGSGGDASGAPETSVRLVERDVEAPQVFQAEDQALWDGRPSLGGVWVASPDAVDPERVILRNPGNGRFVIGALFRRERMNPGPALQISSDAAAALGILAGQPTRLSVIALRREEVPAEQPAAPAAPILDAAEPVTTAPLDRAAAAAIDRAEAAARPAAPPAPPVAAPAATATLAPAPATGGSLIQIGIFSVEANARRAVETLGRAGVTATIRAEETQGRKFWSVTARGTASTLAQVKAAGFGDAYILKR